MPGSKKAALRVRGTEDRNAQIADGGEPAPPTDHGGAGEDVALQETPTALPQPHKKPPKPVLEWRQLGLQQDFKSASQVGQTLIEQSLLESSAVLAPTVTAPIAMRKTAPTAQTTVTTAPGALDPVVTMIPEPASATKDDPPPWVTLLSLADFDNDEIEAMNQERQVVTDFSVILVF
ncbi:uncharacterized protein LACBIDRAFT_335835 [Laccaria bicolor S238N-H82]|uniref:Predicted protein n=1 Tax=Laccaria bicolor (strain S238N-H82 / ATCC MYA-4686) TaxID=486041 RepID=B0E3K4_LACBS|nr:uncharacterized protein LACBIDRAFT_335835 [Laccaria bicolor S238N-H82]EDQ98577.1 predicted protein [Laccaria bicolor S238N-H82]|eukprot:XP_001890773.1 predicted protein [Laccaria bicolor S238N-H82]